MILFNCFTTKISRLLLQWLVWSLTREMWYKGILWITIRTYLIVLLIHWTKTPKSQSPKIPKKYRTGNFVTAPLLPTPTKAKSIYFRKQDDLYFRTGFASQVPLSCNWAIFNKISKRSPDSCNSQSLSSNIYHSQVFLFTSQILMVIVAS